MNDPLRIEIEASHLEEWLALVESSLTPSIEFSTERHSLRAAFDVRTRNLKALQRQIKGKFAFAFHNIEH